MKAAWSISIAALALVALAGTASASRSTLIGRPVADTRLKSVDGKPMNPSQAHGHYLLYVFSDEKSKALMRNFMVENAARLASVKPLSIWSISVPAQRFVPRASSTARTRAETRKIVDAAREGLMSHQVAGFNELDFRFYSDYNRETSSQFGVGPHGLTLVLLDPNGYIVVHETNAEEPAIHRVIDAIKAHQLAPGSVAYGPPRPRREVAVAARTAAADYLGIQARPRGPRAADEDRLAVYDTPAPAAPPAEAAATLPAQAPAGASKSKSKLHYNY